MEPDFPGGDHLSPRAAIPLGRSRAAGSARSARPGSFGRRRAADFRSLLAEDTVCTAALSRRDALEAVGGFDSDPRVDGYEDWDLAISLVENGYTGEIIPEFLFRYRIRPHSKSATRTTPENHASVVEYIVEKHAATYERHAPGVVARIRERIAWLVGACRSAPSARCSARRAALATINPRFGELPADARGAVQAPPAKEGPAPLEWGSFRRVDPVSRVWGLDRGQPIDRYYIERFLAAHRRDIRGRVLEAKDPGYTRQFGDGVAAVEVVDVAAENPDATLIADLAQPRSLPEDRFDCFILTQTIHVIYDVAEVVKNAFRTLRPGGVVLATLPCVSRVDYESGLDSDYWRFTPALARRLFESAFGPGNVEVEVYGNVLAGTAFLQGLAADELSQDELDHVDPYYPLTVAVRAQRPLEADEERTPMPKSKESSIARRARSSPAGRGIAQTRRTKSRSRFGRGSDESPWSVASDFRQDLANAGKGKGDVAFSCAPLADLHGDPALTVRASVKGYELWGSPLPVECVCGRTSVRVPEDAEESEVWGVRISSPNETGGMRSYLDSPVAGSQVEFPWMDIAGWAIPTAGPLEAVELAHGSEVFRTVRPHSRPDLTGAFAEIPWAPESGFAVRVSLLGLDGDIDITLRAVSSDGTRAEIGRVAFRPRRSRRWRSCPCWSPSSPANRLPTPRRWVNDAASGASSLPLRKRTSGAGGATRESRSGTLGRLHPNPTQISSG